MHIKRRYNIDEIIKSVCLAMMKNSQQSWLKKMKNIPWHECGKTRICLDGVVRADVCGRACSLQDVFTPAGWSFPVSIPHDKKGETEWEKERKKRKGGRERERQKYREREDTLGQTDHQWPSFPQLCQWLNWSLLPGWLCVWMRCAGSQNTHRWSYFFKWMSYNHINTLDGLWIFFSPSLWLLRIPNSMKSTKWPSNWQTKIVWFVRPKIITISSFSVPFLQRAKRYLLAYYLIYDPHHLALPILCHWTDWRVLLYPYSELKISPWPMQGTADGNQSCAAWRRVTWSLSIMSHWLTSPCKHLERR